MASGSKIHLKSKKRRPRISIVFEEDDDGSVTSMSSVSISYKEEKTELGMTERAKMYRFIFYLLVTITITVLLYIPISPAKPKLEKKVGNANSSKGRKKSRIRNNSSAYDSQDRLLHGSLDAQTLEEDLESKMGFDEFVDLQSKKEKLLYAKKKELERFASISKSQIHKLYSIYKPVLGDSDKPLVVPMVNPRFGGIVNTLQTYSDALTDDDKGRLLTRDNNNLRPLATNHEPLSSIAVSNDEGRSDNIRVDSLEIQSIQPQISIETDTYSRLQDSVTIPESQIFIPSQNQGIESQTQGGGDIIIPGYQTNLLDENQQVNTDRVNQQNTHHLETQVNENNVILGYETNLNFEDPIPVSDRRRLLDIKLTTGSSFPSYRDHDLGSAKRNLRKLLQTQEHKQYRPHPSLDVRDPIDYMERGDLFSKFSKYFGRSDFKVKSQRVLSEDIQGMEGLQVEAIKSEDDTKLGKTITAHRQLESVHSDSNSEASGKVTEVASFHKICNAVVGEIDEKLMEKRAYCHDEIDPSASLATIFLSSYLSYYARMYGYRAEYEHNCARHRYDQRLIQELFPSPIVFPNVFRTEIPKDHLVNLCKRIIDNSNSSTIFDILLWDTNPNDESQRKDPPMSVLERLSPVIFATMYNAGIKSRLVKSALKAGYGVLQDRDSFSDHLAFGRAVVYLPCRDKNCNDLAIIPYSQYLLHLPLNVHIIDIVTSPRCREKIVGCKNYVDDLASILREFTPDVAVEVILAEPSSPDVIARLLEAEYVFCGPGYGMVCLIPALGRDSGRMTLFDLDSDGKDISNKIASTFVAKLPSELVRHLTPPQSAFSVAFLSEFGGDMNAMNKFSQMPVNSEAGDCRFFRGRVGVWNQDMAYAPYAQYQKQLYHYSGNAERFFRRKVKKGEYGDLMYRPSTTYRFDEARYQNCAITPISQPDMCNLLKKLGIRRIFILGDSLNLQLAQSMWMWLSNVNDGESPTPKGSLEPNFKSLLQCTSYSSYSLEFIRNDELLENDDPVSIEKDQKNCNSFCYPWTKSYLEDSSRTILIFNTGAHLHEFDRFQAAIDRFIETIDKMKRPNDLVMYRTLVPGHWDCGRPGLHPFPDFLAYKKDTEDHPNIRDSAYTWSKFTAYNDYAIRQLDYRRYNTFTPKALMEIVDVFPMTILRPDGHCSDEFRPPRYLETDCLHYDLPGPIDWWTHLIFSHVKDIANAEEYLAKQLEL